MDEKRSFEAGVLRGLHSVHSHSNVTESISTKPLCSLSIFVTTLKIFTKIWLAAVSSVHVPNRVGIGLHRFRTQKASKMM